MPVKTPIYKEIGEPVGPPVVVPGPPPPTVPSEIIGVPVVPVTPSPITPIATPAPTTPPAVSEPASAFSWSAIVNFIGGAIDNATAALKSWVKDLLSTLKNDIQSSLTLIITWGNGLVSALENSIQALGTQITTWVNGLISNVYGLIASVVITLTAWVNALFGKLEKGTQSLLDQMTAWVIGLFGKLEKGTQSLLEDLRSKLTGMFEPLLAFLPWLKDIQPLLDTRLLATLRDFTSRLYMSVSEFFRDPVGWILSILWPTIIHYLCYAAAYALGTVNETLPPIPAWGIPGAGGPLPTPLPPGPGVEGLVHPCEPLYVSGYTFTAAHPGTDFGIVNAQPIYAAHDGLVEESHWVDYGFGWTITIRGGHYWSRYGHLEQLLVASGQAVSAGQVIAYGNSTGNSTGPHLHFELKIDGAYVDPVSVL